jgi:1-acyl-sn-glycerol-3-phosphate acyltransferase
MTTGVDVRRRPVFLALARRYVHRRVAREFDGLFVEGLSRARTLAAGEPLILAANHVAWWDALLAIEIDAALGTEGYCLMDAANLRRLPFFAWAGAVPLRRESVKAAHEDLRAAADLLDRAGRMLWMFPQGRQRRAHLRPLGLGSGVRMLARLSGARVLPMSLDYAYREGPAPSILVSFSEPVDATSRQMLAALEARLCEGLERIDRFVDRGDGDFETIVSGRAQQTRAEGPIGARVLSAFGRRAPKLGDGEPPR